MATSAWPDRIAEVFSTNPRFLTRGTSHSRRPEMEALKRHFGSAGESVCIDGPSGAGKTSLALTYVIRAEIQFTYVQVTKRLDWRGFCRQVIDPHLENIEHSLTSELEIGVQQLLPFARLKVALGEKQSAKSAEDYIQALSANWSEIDIGQQVLRKNVCLIVDDLDQANEEVLTRVASLCKYLLLGSRSSRNARCLLIGTGDIYRRVLSTNEALTLRLNEVSLGSFEHPRDSWSFLARGFNALAIPFEESSERQSRKRTQLELQTAMMQVYEAANGLPKSLNKLGQQIALISESGVTPEAIRSVCDEMVRENWDFHSEEYPDLIKVLRSSEPAKLLLRTLYEQGACSVFKKSTLLNVLSAASTHSRREIEDGLTRLVEVNFLTLTGGKGKQVVFPVDSVATHTLGVVLNNRYRFPDAADVLGDFNLGYQLRLDFDSETVA
jgi:hypothetical protein